jgi:hypothetical protein
MSRGRIVLRKDGGESQSLSAATPQRTRRGVLSVPTEGAHCFTPHYPQGSAPKQNDSPSKTILLIETNHNHII